jgi:hypothetical protein
MVKQFYNRFDLVSKLIMRGLVKAIVNYSEDISASTIPGSSLGPQEVSLSLLLIVEHILGVE